MLTSFGIAKKSQSCYHWNDVVCIMYDNKNNDNNNNNNDNNNNFIF